MTAGLAAGITAVVVAACAAGAYLYSIHHFSDLLETERSTALAQAELMRAALEHQMIENDRSLIGEMVRTFGREARVANVVLLDRLGVARYSSAPIAAVDLDQNSATCQACHRLPADQFARVRDSMAGRPLELVWRLFWRRPFERRERMAFRYA